MRPDPATDRSSAARRAGSALVECLVALAVAAAVFLPALAAVRAAVRADARTADRAEDAAAARPAARAAAARLRLGAAVRETDVREGEGGPRVGTIVAEIRGEGAEPLPGGESPRAASARAGSAVSSLAAPPPLRGGP